MYTWLKILNAQTMMTIGDIYKMSDLKTFMEKYGAFLSEYYFALYCLLHCFLFFYILSDCCIEYVRKECILS